MTAGRNPTSSRPPDHNDVSRRYFAHSSGDRVNTDAVIVDALRKEYPNLHLTVTPVDGGGGVLGFAAAGHAAVAPIDKEAEQLKWKLFVPARRRLDGDKGTLADDVKFAKYLVDWEGKEFVMYVADCRDGTGPYPEITNQYILSASVDAVNRLLLQVGTWSNELHNEVWVFDRGYWQKSRELWESMSKASWDDVILDESMKEALITDTDTFFDSRDTYERLKVPWKRGIIYYGPPGNGKTISIKAIMHSLYSRPDPIPTLYVKTLTSFGGPEASLAAIFNRARSTAPCYLVFEDLDSIVTDQVRSYFLNEVDGIKKNDGILMIGSTNHLERLDPGISKRPSRFDRKYKFDNPSFDERVLYMKYWQSKLADNDSVDFPDKLCPAVAKITDGFSFAYMQEAMVAALLVIARDADGFVDRVCLECLEPHGVAANGVKCENEGKRVFKGLFDWVWLVREIDAMDSSLDDLVLWREIKKQVRILKEELGIERERR